MITHRLAALIIIAQRYFKRVLEDESYPLEVATALIQRFIYQHPTQPAGLSSGQMEAFILALVQMHNEIVVRIAAINPPLPSEHPLVAELLALLAAQRQYLKFAIDTSIAGKYEEDVPAQSSVINRITRFNGQIIEKLETGLGKDFSLNDLVKQVRLPAETAPK